LMLFSKDLGFKTQSQNMTAEHVSIAYDSTTVFVTGVSDTPGLLPDVVGMGAGDAVYLLEKAGYKTRTNGFGRVFRQSPTPGMPCSKGETISLELGFDELEIMKKDSIARADSIQGPILSSVPLEKPRTEPKPVAVPVAPKVDPNPPTAAKANQKSAVKPKPTQEAINKWKAKVAAKKAADKKKKASKKSTNTTKKPQQ
jgi:beta-lactam-binding protein with PASTA domain